MDWSREFNCVTKELFLLKDQCMWLVKCCLKINTQIKSEQTNFKQVKTYYLKPVIQPLYANGKSNVN